MILASLILIADSFQFGDALVVFFLTGTVPATTIRINAALMLSIYAIIAGFVLSRAVNSLFFSYRTNK